LQRDLVSARYHPYNYLHTVKQLLLSQNDGARQLGLLEYYFRMENLEISSVPVYANPPHSELLIQLAVNLLQPNQLEADALSRHHHCGDSD